MDGDRVSPWVKVYSLPHFGTFVRSLNEYLKSALDPLSGLQARVFLSFVQQRPTVSEGAFISFIGLHAYGKFERFKVPLGLDIEHRAHVVLLMLERRVRDLFHLHGHFPLRYVLGRFCIEPSRIQFVDYKRKNPTSLYTRPTMRPTILWQ